MLFKRIHSEILFSRISEERDKIQVLIGPRQVGKTTLMEQVLSSIDVPYTLAKADNVNPSDNDWIHRTWESARAQIRSKQLADYLLVIDEIQKISNWSEVVKAEWDWDTSNHVPLKVILLGSSRIMIQSGLKESLAGRFELIRMGHWSYTEMKEAFGMSLEQYIYFGGYPGAARFVHDEKRWKRYIKDSIIAPAIDKDVVLTSNIYKPALMKQLFTLGCKYSSDELALTKIVGQLQDSGNVTTLASYLDLLSQCQLVTGLQKYANDEARKYNSVPKFGVFNNALLSANTRASFTSVRNDPQTWGKWVESAVGAHLLSAAEEQDYQVFYWRERNDEVDFIVQADDICIAFEVKSGRRATNRGVHIFDDKFHPTHTYIVGTGGIPLEDFLSSSVEVWF